jgi:hypothetical protein
VLWIRSEQRASPYERLGKGALMVATAGVGYVALVGNPQVAHAKAATVDWEAVRKVSSIAAYIAYQGTTFSPVARGERGGLGYRGASARGHVTSA